MDDAGDALEAWAAVRAVLLADASVSDLVAGRVVDNPGGSATDLPYIRAGSIEARPDDTDGALGARVSLGLQVHSRAGLDGQVQAQKILAAVKLALHRRDDRLTIFGREAWDCLALASNVERAGDGATHAGTLAVEIRLDAA